MRRVVNESVPMRTETGKGPGTVIDSPRAGVFERSRQCPLAPEIIHGVVLPQKKPWEKIERLPRKILQRVAGNTSRAKRSPWALWEI